MLDYSTTVVLRVVVHVWIDKYSSCAMSSILAPE